MKVTEVTSTLAYYDTKLITARKSLRVKDPGWKSLKEPNTLAYFVKMKIIAQKSFITSAAANLGPML
jgi:hypothetical protein